MDLDDIEAHREPLIYPDEDTGSAYETTSEEEQSSSHDEQAILTRSSRASSVRSRGKKTTRRETFEFEDEELSDAGERQSRGRVSNSPSIDDHILEDVQAWASNFQAPESPGEIRAPRRRTAGSRTRKRALKPANKVRVKRLKRYYSNDYRELLNIDIEDTAARRLQEDDYPLPASQIGSSTWTSSEKDRFFTALTRLGRDNVRGIATQIGSKSELQVQEYIQLLHQGISEKRLHEGRLLAPTDMPAAIQISDECSSVLERAGDALAIRQELAEEKIEKTKFGDSWLLNREVSRFMEKRRKEEGGEAALDEILPAVNLFNLKNWLELSEKVFMNPAEPYEEENWQTLVETGETPAIRATAFTDFHSIAVNITKRLVSTTFYCTMSRLRARDLNKFKHAEVSSGDVEAAINILGLKANDSKFWTGAARRCHLQVINDDPMEDEDEEEDNDKQEYPPMTYDEVESALQQSPSSPSRSRSTSRPMHSRLSSRCSAYSDPALSSPSSLDLGLDFSSSDCSVQDYPTSAAENSDLSSFSSSSSTHFHFSSRRYEAKLKKKVTRRAADKAEDEYTEAFDMQASQLEETRLWALLKQDPPFEEEKVELLEELEMGKRKRGGGDGDWREWVGYFSPWETMEAPLLEEEFARNRRISRKVKRRRVGEVLEDSGASEET
ncbi:hypothetical protein L207DRAFT_412898, partial [Hyaloscypha variabilis F]